MISLPPLPNERHDSVLVKRWVTADMQAYARQAQRMALEEAAKECESIRSGMGSAIAIRRLANELEAKP